MTINVAWDNDSKYVVRFDVTSKSDWNEFSHAVETAKAMIGSADATVDLIINASQGAAPPPGALLKFRRAQESRPANQGVTIIVESNLFARMLFAAFARVYPRLADLMWLAPDLAEARRLAEVWQKARATGAVA